MQSDRVCAAAEEALSRVAKRGRHIPQDEAMAAARAAFYLKERGRRVPNTLGQAAALDPRERHEFRILCGVWKEWAEGLDLVRCMQAIDFLESIRPSECCDGGPASSYAPAPICGWSPTGPRGVFTKQDWRRKKTAA
jgi:hypothetical protein